MSLSRRTDRWVGPRRGVAAIEFALVAPFIILMMLAGADLTIFMRTNMRIDETATELALVVTQYQDLYDGDFTGLFNAAQTVAGTTTVTGLFGSDDHHRHREYKRNTDDRMAETQPVRPRSPVCSGRQAVFSHCRTTTSCQEAEH